MRAGTAVPDVKVSRAAQEASIAGLAFFRGIPGAIGGALRMNGGAYGRETKDALIEARGVDRQGRVRVFSAMPTCITPIAIAARRTTSSSREALFAGRAGRSRSHCRRDGQDHRVARGDAADQEPHRRFDLQESARQQGVATDRRRRLPRASRSATRRCPKCTATS